MSRKRRILFATTNDNKIKRIRRLIADLDIELLTLSDFSINIKEPEEYGDNAVEVAKNKAIYYWIKTNKSIPVLTQDDTVDFLGNVSSQDDPKTAIKEPVIRMYGEYTVSNAILYYQQLARKYGGEVKFVFRYGHGFVNNRGVWGEGSCLYAKLVEHPKGIDKVGKYPLRALTKIRVGRRYIYSEDATEEEKIRADFDIKRTLIILLS